jgi:hypothetical protein
VSVTIVRVQAKKDGRVEVRNHTAFGVLCGGMGARVIPPVVLSYWIAPSNLASNKHEVGTGNWSYLELELILLRSD